MMIFNDGFENGIREDLLPLPFGMASTKVGDVDAIAHLTLACHVMCRSGDVTGYSGHLTASLCSKIITVITD